MKTNINLRQVAIAAFVIGVVLHACVVLSVVGGGTDSPAQRTSSPAQQQVRPGAAATATRAPDRTTCEEIRGTDYRSEAERQWFRANCSGGTAQNTLGRQRAG